MTQFDTIRAPPGGIGAAVAPYFRVPATQTHPIRSTGIEIRAAHGKLAV